MSLTYNELEQDTRHYFENLESQRKRAIDILFWIVKACVARGFPNDHLWVQPVKERDSSVVRPLPKALGDFQNDEGLWTLRLVLRVDGTPNAYSIHCCELTIRFDFMTDSIDVGFQGDHSIVTLTSSDSTTNQQALDKFVSALFDELKMNESNGNFERTIGFNANEQS